MVVKSFAFEILTLQRVFLREDVQFVIAPGQEGVFEILPGHAPFLFALRPGLLQIRRTDDTDRYVLVGRGFLVVQKDRTTAMVRSAEDPEDIDVERARRAKERAERRLETWTSDDDRNRAQEALQRAKARLKARELG